MNRDQRLLLVAVGEASQLETLFTRLEVTFSSSAKAKYHQFSAVNTILAATLSDPDDRITVTLKRQTGTKSLWKSSWSVLALLVTVLFFEWRNFTIPILAQAFKFIAHKCGVQ